MRYVDITVTVTCCKKSIVCILLRTIYITVITVLLEIDNIIIFFTIMSETGIAIR